MLGLDYEGLRKYCGDVKVLGRWRDDGLWRGKSRNTDNWVGRDLWRDEYEWAVCVTDAYNRVRIIHEYWDSKVFAVDAKQIR